MNEVAEGLAQLESQMHVPVSLDNLMAFYLISNQTAQVHGDTVSQEQGSVFSFIELHEVFPACQVPFEWQLYPAAFSLSPALNFHLQS